MGGVAYGRTQEKFRAVRIRRGDSLEAVQQQLLTGMRYAYMQTEDLPRELGLPGMAGAFCLNVLTMGEASGRNDLPDLIRGDTGFAAAQSAVLGPPPGIDRHLTLMVFTDRQIRLDYYYSPAFIDRAFVKHFAGALLKRLRCMTADEEPEEETETETEMETEKEWKRK